MEEARLETQQETALIARALEGDRASLTLLIETHRAFLYNVALKFFNNIDDAQDATQEVLIKVISRLSTYEPSRGAFRTWLYRITFHHYLNSRTNAYEKNVTGFGVFFDLIDSVPSQTLTPEEEVTLALDVRESMVSCTSGMIMCLDREQRLVYIVGELFGLENQLASEALAISPEAFRQKLSRARRDLREWMDQRCGLVHAANPCRCPKKTKGFIAKGWVNPDNRKWHSDTTHRIRDLVADRMDDLVDTRERLYASFFQEHPFKQPKEGARAMLDSILSEPTYGTMFGLSHPGGSAQ